MTIAERLKQARKARGLNLREAGALAGISFATISRIERETHVNTFASIDAYARVLGYRLMLVHDESDGAQ